MKPNLFDEWQKIRNGPWQDQENFVNLLIVGLTDAHSVLEFFADDKYVSNSGFKHVDGTVRETVEQTLSDFKKSMRALLSQKGRADE